MVESTLECSHGLAKQLLAKTWLTKSCSSSKGGKVPSKSHCTTPNEDGQMGGGWFVALHPQPNGQSLVLGIDAMVLVAAQGLWGAAVMHSS